MQIYFQIAHPELFISALLPKDEVLLYSIFMDISRISSILIEFYGKIHSDSQFPLNCI